MASCGLVTIRATTPRRAAPRGTWPSSQWRPDNEFETDRSSIGDRYAVHTVRESGEESIETSRYLFVSYCGGGVWWGFLNANGSNSDTHTGSDTGSDANTGSAGARTASLSAIARRLRILGC